MRDRVLRTNVGRIDCWEVPALLDDDCNPRRLVSRPEPTLNIQARKLSWLLKVERIEPRFSASATAAVRNHDHCRGLAKQRSVGVQRYEKSYMLLFIGMAPHPHGGARSDD